MNNSNEKTNLKGGNKNAVAPNKKLSSLPNNLATGSR